MDNNNSNKVVENTTIFPGFSIKDILKLSSIYGISMVLDRIISFILLPILTYYLSKESYGTIVLLYGLLDFIRLISTFGFPDTLAKTYWDYDDTERKKSLGTAWIFMSAVNLLLCALIIMLNSNISECLSLNISNKYIFLFLAIRLFLSIQPGIPTIIMRSKENKFRILLVNITNVVSRLGFTIFFIVFMKSDLEGVILADICSSLLTFICYFTIYIKDVSFSFRFTYLKHIMAIAPYQFLISIFAWIITLSDRLILQLIDKNPSIVGLYGVGYAFGSALFLLTRPVLTAWRPHIYSVRSKDEKEYESRTEIFYKFFSLYLAVSFLLTATFLPEVIRILTPVFYHQSSIILVYILAAHTVAMFSNVFLTNFFVKEKVQVLAFTHFVGAGVNIIANFILIPYLSVKGAALATLVAYFLRSIMLIYQSQKLIRLRVNFLSTFFLTLLTLIIWYGGSMISYASPYWTLIAKFIYIGAVFLLCIIIKKFLFNDHQKQTAI